MTTDLWIAAALLMAALPGHSTTIFAVAGNLEKAKDTTNSSFSSMAPAANSSIQWFSGPNNLDGTVTQSPRVSLGAAQNYFGAGNAGQALGPVSATYGPGGAGSTVTNSGEGNSSSAVKAGVGTVYTANWSATATGHLGGGANAQWHAHTDGVDPWSMNASDFSNLPGPTFDLFFMAGITDADFDSLDSGINFDVGYRTGGGTIALLQMSANGSGAQAHIGSLSGLEIFLLSSPTDGPADISGSPLTAADIQGLLMGLVNTGSLSSPLIFGFELNGQAIPTQDMGGGTLAQFTVDAGVSDGAAGSAVPEPASLSLFAAGGVLIVLGRLRRRGHE
jgi:hypothetical protein